MPILRLHQQITDILKRRQLLTRLSYRPEVFYTSFPRLSPDQSSTIGRSFQGRIVEHDDDIVGCDVYVCSDCVEGGSDSMWGGGGRKGGTLEYLRLVETAESTDETGSRDHPQQHIAA